MKMLSLSIAAVLGLSLAAPNPILAQDSDVEFVAPTSLDEAVLPGIATAGFVHRAFVPPTSLDEAVIRGVSTEQRPERRDLGARTDERRDAAPGRARQRFSAACGTAEARAC